MNEKNFEVINIKVYLYYTSIFCHKVALNVQLMNFFIWRKNVSFSRHQDFQNPQISMSVVSLWTLLRNGTYTFAYFFWMLPTIKIKLHQILVHLITNVSIIFLAQCWRLETSSRPLFDFNKVTIYQYLSIFSNFFFFLIGIHSMQGWTATTRHGVTRKEAEKRLHDTENLFNDIYHFEFSLIQPFQKNETLETWHNWLLSN